MEQSDKIQTKDLIMTDITETIIPGNPMSNINKYVSDVIGDEYQSWNNESIFLDFSTGKGKTQFILKELASYVLANNKKILYLCNRLQLYKKVNSMIQDNQISDVVYLMTYQSLQEKIKNGVEIPHFDYVVADEAHYLTDDSSFNDSTDFSYNFLKDAIDCVTIYMTATATCLYDILLEEGSLSKDRYYHLPPDYSYVDKIYFYKRKSHIEIIKYLLSTTQDRIIYFSSSNSKWLDAVHEFGEDANRICSIHTKNIEMSKLNQPDCITTINDSYVTFDKRLLISTKTLDCGIDLKDVEIKHIICDISDLNSCLQCIGRKRVLNEDDTVNLYIRDYSSNELILNLQNRKNEVEPMELFLHNMDSFKEKYNHREMYYGFYVDWNDQMVHVNLMKYRNKLYEISLLEKAIQTSYRRLFINFMGNVTQKISGIPIASVIEKEKLLDFLEENKDKELTSYEKEDLINIINLRDNRNRLQKSIGILNAYLAERRIDYVILSKRKSDARRTFYWIIR